MKRMLCIMFSLALLLMWHSINIAAENWQEGIIDKITETTITMTRLLIISLLIQL